MADEKNTVEELHAELLKLAEEKKGWHDERAAFEEKTKQLSERVQSLQEHNQKLFLKLTSDEPEEKEEPKKGIKDLDLSKLGG